MNMYPQYKSKSGYYINDDGIDSYGVNHKNFTTRDELEYQFARVEREKQMINDYNKNEINSQNVMNNVENNNLLSDEKLYEKMWDNIKLHEDVIPHPYLDTKGYITVGGGANINNINDFMKTNFLVNGMPATNEQKLNEYYNLRRISDEKDDFGNYQNRNIKADDFKYKTKLRITDDYARSLAQKHMNNDLAHLRRQFNDFDKFPIELKEVLLDIQYNTGKLTPKHWPNLFRVIEECNVNDIRNNVHRKDVHAGRNDWARSKLNSMVCWRD